jgi:CRISP-associated protein Cas1
VARALVSSGLLLTLGIHHRNKYNAYALADDIMEPYRPYVDRVVVKMIMQNLPQGDILTPEHKKWLLQIPVLDVSLMGKERPLMHAVSSTTSGLAKCFLGEERIIPYPNLY